MTHYIPAFTVRVQDKQQAVCGEAVKAAEHSTEPTCPKCREYLER